MLLPTGGSPGADRRLRPRATKNNAGHYSELTLEVMDGPHKVPRVRDRLNLDNLNAQAVEIANRTFSSIREATGVTNPRDRRNCTTSRS